MKKNLYWNFNDFVSHVTYLLNDINDISHDVTKYNIEHVAFSVLISLVSNIPRYINSPNLVLSIEFRREYFCTIETYMRYFCEK